MQRDIMTEGPNYYYPTPLPLSIPGVVGSIVRFHSIMSKKRTRKPCRKVLWRRVPIIIIIIPPLFRGGGGGRWRRKEVWACVAVMTPLFSGQSALLSLPIYHHCAALIRPFSNFRKKIPFSALFWSTQTNKQNKGQKTKTNMHSHKTEMLSQHSHTTPHTTLHTHWNCRKGDMIYVGQINKK